MQNDELFCQTSEMLFTINDLTLLCLKQMARKKKNLTVSALCYVLGLLTLELTGHWRECVLWVFHTNRAGIKPAAQAAPRFEAILFKHVF